MSFERTTPCGAISGTACQWPGIAAYKGILQPAHHLGITLRK